MNERLFNLVFDFCVPRQMCIKASIENNIKNKDVIERHGIQRRLRRVTIPCNWYLMIKLLIMDVFSLNFIYIYVIFIHLILNLTN